jgi:hypothetical protein
MILIVMLRRRPSPWNIDQRLGVQEPGGLPMGLFRIGTLYR